MTLPVLTGHRFTPDRGRDLLVVGPSLGTGVVPLWGPCVEALTGSRDVDVLGWDLPGHGEGGPHDAPFTLDELAAAVVALVERERPGMRFVHAGVSVAGVTSLALAVGHGDPQGSGRVRGAAVICSDARVGTADGWHERADLVRRSGTAALVEGSAARWFAPGFLEREPRVAAGLLTSLQHADAASYARVCEALAAADYRRAAQGVTVPVLVMGGRHDVVCTPEDQQRLAASVPGARLVIVEDAAHLAPAEVPAEVAEVLADWLGGVR